MTINREDIKLKAPERLTDNDDGGGNMTGTEIVDGQVNNVFDDISRINRTAGNTSLRKVFAHVDTDNEDKYLGGHAALFDAPDDPNVSLILFNTDSESDERSNAKTRVESYLAPATPFGMFALSNQLEGQKNLQMFGIPGGYTTPEIGQTIAIAEEDYDQQEVIFQQFAKIEAVTVTAGLSWGGSFEYDLIVLEISKALQQDFGGFAEPKEKPAYNDTDQATVTVVRDTLVANAAVYAGISNFTAAALANDTQLSVDSIFSQLVPSNTSEEPIIDAIPGGVGYGIHQAGDELSQVWISSGASGAHTRYLATGAMPGSVTLNINGSAQIEDDSTGKLIRISNGAEVGTIDYASGRIDVELWTNAGTNQTATYTPAVQISGLGKTEMMLIAEQNRGFNYTGTLSPIPVPGSMSVSYRALGRWYTLTDNGKGELVSDGAGTGSVNFATGTALITFAREPDADTPILTNYSNPDSYERAEAEANAEPLTALLDAGEAILPSSLTVEWDDGTGTQQVTDDGDGNLTGDGTGRVNYALGVIVITPATLPASSSNFAATYTVPDTSTAYTDTGSGGGSKTFTLDNAPVEAGTVSFKTVEAMSIGGSATYQWKDNGDGTLAGWLESSTGAGFYQLPVAGTINYTNGEVAIPDVGRNIGEYTSRERVS